MRLTVQQGGDLADPMRKLTAEPPCSSWSVQREDTSFHCCIFVIFWKKILSSKITE